MKQLLFMVFILSACVSARKNKKETANPPDINKQIELLGESIVDCDTKLMAFYAHKNQGKPTRTFYCGKVQAPMGDDSEKTVGLTYIYFPPANFLKNPKIVDPVIFSDIEQETAIEEFLSKASLWNNLIDAFGVLVVETRGGSFSDPYIHCQASAADSVEKSVKKCADDWRARFPIDTLNMNQVTKDILHVTQAIGVTKFYFISQSAMGDYIIENLAAMAPERLHAVALTTDERRLALTKANAQKRVMDSLVEMDNICNKDTYCKQIVGPLGRNLPQKLTENTALKEDIIDYIGNRLKLSNEIDDLYIRLHGFQGGDTWRQQLQAAREKESNVFALTLSGALPLYCDVLEANRSVRKNFNDFLETQRICSSWKRLPSMPLPLASPVSTPVLVTTGSVFPLEVKEQNRISKNFAKVTRFNFSGNSSVNTKHLPCAAATYVSFFSHPDQALKPCGRVLQFETLLHADQLAIPDAEGWRDGVKNEMKFLIYKSSNSYMTEVHAKALYWQLYQQIPNAWVKSNHPSLGFLYRSTNLQGKSFAATSFNDRYASHQLIVAVQVAKGGDAAQALEQAYSDHQASIRALAHAPVIKLHSPIVEEEQQSVSEEEPDDKLLYEQSEEEMFPANIFLRGQSQEIPNFKKVREGKYDGNQGRMLEAYRINATDKEAFHILRYQVASQKGWQVDDTVHSIDKSVLDYDDRVQTVKVFYSRLSNKGYAYSISLNSVSYIYFTPDDEMSFFIDHILAKIYL